MHMYGARPDGPGCTHYVAVLAGVRDAQTLPSALLMQPSTEHLFLPSCLMCYWALRSTP